MSKKAISIVALALLAAFVVFLFIPGVFLEEYWKAKFPGSGTYSVLWTDPCSAVIPMPVLTVILALVCAVGILALAMQIAGKRGKAFKVLCFASVAAVVLWAVLACAACLTTIDNASYGFSSYLPGWGFYVASALVLAAAIMSVIVAVKKFKEMPQAVGAAGVSGADELKKYKELLDSGVISEEEFAAKKKQLLGL